MCEFVDALEEPQYHVSRSLKILQKAGLVARTARGQVGPLRVAGEAGRRSANWRSRPLPPYPRQVLAKDQRELNRRLKLRENGKCLLGVQKTHLLSRRKLRTGTMNRSVELKQLLHAKETLVMPDAYDAISARIIEQAGFKAVQCSGYSFSVAACRKKEIDIGLAENLALTAAIVQAVRCR